MKRALLTISALTLTVALGACTPLGAGITVGSAAGVAAASEGGFKGSLSDTAITAKINDLWFRHDVEMFSKSNMSVNQGRVLLTGVVQKPEHRVEAVRLAWQADGVTQVINEIKVADSEGLKGWARDNWISARLRSAILFDKDIQGVNYSIDTVQGTVYLMGVAQNQAELDRVIAHARGIDYVKNVVSHVKLIGVPVTGAMPSGQTVAIQPYQPTATSQPTQIYNSPASVQSETIYQDYNTVVDSYGTQQVPAGNGRSQPIVGNEF